MPVSLPTSLEGGWVTKNRKSGDQLQYRQTLAGSRGRPPHPLELTALSSSSWEGFRNLVPAGKERKESSVSWIWEAKKLFADFGREPGTWLRVLEEGRGRP